MEQKNRDRKEWNEPVREHVLVCLSSAPSNAKIIRTASRMAAAYHCPFTALYVETPDFSAATEENKNRLRSNQRLAEQLGASVEVIYGEDVAYQIAEYARISGVTQILLGRSVFNRKHLFGKPTLTEQLLSYAPEIDVHIIPDKQNETVYFAKKKKEKKSQNMIENIIKSVGILVGATFLGIVFSHLGFTDANIIMVFILGVLLTSIAVPNPIYSLFSSAASVLIFNFLFTIPRFSLMAYGTGYPVTFLIMFLTAYITGTFAIRYKTQARESAKTAYRTKILFDMDQLLSKAGGKEEIVEVTAHQVRKLLDRNILFFELLDGVLSEPKSYVVNEEEVFFPDLQKERVAAELAISNSYGVDSMADGSKDAACMYFVLRVNQRVYGALGVEKKNEPLDASQHDILLSMLGEAALALENEKNTREKEAAAVLAEREQLRANLLRSISHDLRTPLTTISGNANNLVHHGMYFDEITKRQIYQDIYEDAMWLTHLVENLLYTTKIEEGRMMLRISTELLSEIVEESVRHMEKQEKDHRIQVVYEEELLLVKADAKLIMQVIVNLIDNAMKYTPAESDIQILMSKAGNMARVSVADRGSGIAEEEKEKIFDKFYCGTNPIADNRRSLGLGLYLCKTIIQAHQGEIWVQDRSGGGAEFCFTLPMEEVPCHE